jgi:ParB family chromosome partitioning protein
MKKRKINLDKLKKASKDATMQMYKSDQVSHAKQIQDIDINLIVENPHQPRIYIDDQSLKELADSIQENGLLQPISLNQIAKNQYHIIAGHRRYKAFKMLKKDKIPAIIFLKNEINTDEYNINMINLALIENLQRENLNIIEIAISFKNVLTNKIYKNTEELAKNIGKSKSYISKIVSILKLNDTIIEDLAKNKTIKDIETLYELQKINDSNLQISLYNDLVAGKLTRSDLREHIKKIKNVSHAKQIRPFNLTISKKKITFNTNLEILSEKQREVFSQELTQLLKKYFNNCE